MIQVKHIKKVTVFILLLVTTIALVACTKKDNVPYGTLTNDNYANVGDVKITEKELYDNLRRQSTNAINELIEVKLFEGYLVRAEKLLTDSADEDSLEEWAQKMFDDLINQAVFKTTNIDTIKEYKEDQIDLLITQYADSLFVANKSTNREAVVNELNDFVDPTRINENDEDLDTFAKGYGKSDLLRPEFIIELQKRLYAEELLREEQKDTKSDNLIKDSQVISHYKANEKGQQDLNVFYFHFLSTNEANAAFRQLNLKTNSYGDWYRIADIRQFPIEDDPRAEYAIQKAKDAGISEDSLTQDPDNTGFTKVNDEQYRKYYELYTPSSTREAKLSNKEVLEAFVELYNIVNDSKLDFDIDAHTTGEYIINHVNNDSSIGEQFDGNKTFEEMKKVNTTLTSYIYSNLTAEKPYSTLRSVGTHRYLVFQLEETLSEIDYVSANLDADKNEQWVTIEELKEIYSVEKPSTEQTKKRLALHKALKQQNLLVNDNLLDTEGNIIFDVENVKWDDLTPIMEENIKVWTERVFKSKLTSTYASGKVSALLKDEAKIEIYDSIIRALYNQAGTLEAKGSNKAGNDVVSVKISVKGNDNFKDFTITVDELFELLETSIGVTAALDELVNKMLVEEYNKKDGMFSNLTKEQLDTTEFNKEYKQLIKNFSGDQFAQAGYPASMGREAFLLLMFGTTDKAQAIERGFLVPQLRTLYTSGFDIQRGDFEVYEFLAKYSTIQHTEFSGIKVSHLLVFYDQDGDGTPEDPAEFLDKLTAAERTAHIELIAELYDEVQKEIGNNQTLSSALSALVDEYQETARIKLGFGEKRDERDSKWSKFRKAGLNLKFENLPNEITNTSNFPTAQSTLDEVFYDRAMQLNERIQLLIEEGKENNEELVDGGVPFLDMGGSLNINGLSEINDGELLVDLLDNKQGTAGNEYGIRSSFGYHFLLVNEISEKTSAKYEESKDSNKDYQFEGKKLVNNELVDHTFSVYNDSETISADQIEYYVVGNKRDEAILMPSAVKSAFTKYYDPVLALFNNQNTKSALFFDYVSGINFQTAANKTVFDALKELNETQFRGYITDNDRYDALYADWFKDLKVA